jgi:hypothetical protein
MRASLAGCGGLAVLLLTAPCGASEAETLFNEGKALLAAGRTEEACAKLEQSERLEHGVGVLFHLGLCLERTGRTASAWSAFLTVASEAKAHGQGARERVAREHAARVERKVVRVRVDVRETTATGLSLLRDGIAVDRSEWGVPIAIDPGTFVFQAVAPERVPWRSVVEITTERHLWTVVVPALDVPPRSTLIPAATAQAVAIAVPDDRATRAAASSPEPGGLLRPMAIASGAVGVLAAATGVYFGARAIDKNDAAAVHCRENQCDATGVGLRDDALANGTLSTAAFVVGAGLLVGAGVLWFLSPNDADRRAARIELVPGAGRVALRGTW